MKILTFTRTGDVHASHIQQILALQGHELIILEREHYGTEWTVSCQETPDPIIFIELNDATIDQTEISAIWHRVNFTVEDLDFFGLSPEENAYVAAQRSIHVNSIIRALSYVVPCLNSPSANWNAQSKVLQTIKAKEAGLTTPNGFRGGSPGLAEQYLLSRGASKVCTKPLEAVHLERAGQKFAKMTKVIDVSEYLEDLQSLRQCPLVLQDYIDKEYELRVTIVGDEIFSCAIDASLASPDAQMDWRNYDIANTPHRIQPLPHEISEKLMTLHKSLDLIYGAYDLIKSKKFGYVFLEVNSMGQWLWIEDLTDLPISDAIARTLVSLGTA